MDEMTISDMMSAVFGKDELAEAGAKREVTFPLLEARLITLSEFHAKNATVFEVGALVTPTPESGCTEAFIGEPHLVLRVGGSGECNSSRGMVKVVTIAPDGDAIFAWLEPFQLTLWEPKAV